MLVDEAARATRWALVATMLVSLAADANAKRSPDDQAAIATARSWLHAVMDGDVKQTVTMTALPFEVSVEDAYYRPRLKVRSGRAVTRASLLEVLAALTKFCHAEGCCATSRPRAAVHVRTARSGVRVVSFILDGNKLVDGSYFDVYVHVDPATGLVVRAVFDGFNTG